MKILHCGDLHLGSPLTSRLSGERLARRREELTASFFRLVEVAKREGVRAFLLAGDVFDSERVTEVHISDFLSEIEKNPQIDFFYISGNHEKNLLKGRKLPTNLYIFGDEWQYYVRESVVFAGRDTLSPDMFSTLSFPRDTVNFVLLHGAVCEGRTGEIPLSCAAGRGIDYLALGHYHTYQTFPLDARGVAVYAGAPEGRGFDEVGPRGCVLIDTAGGKVSFRFVETARRLYLTPEVSVDGVTGTPELERRADAVLSDLSRESAVRLTFVGTDAGVPLPISSLRYRYTTEFFLFEIRDRTTPDLRRAVLESPLARAFVACCEEDETLTEEERHSVLRAGLSVLSGDEIPFDLS